MSNDEDKEVFRFEAPSDGELIYNHVDEYDSDGTPIGWGENISVEEGDEVILWFDGEDDE